MIQKLLSNLHFDIKVHTIDIMHQYMLVHVWLYVNVYEGAHVTIKLDLALTNVLLATNYDIIGMYISNVIIPGTYTLLIY